MLVRLLYKLVFALCGGVRIPIAARTVGGHHFESCLFIRTLGAAGVANPTSVQSNPEKNDGRGMRARRVVIKESGERCYAAVGRTTRLILSIV